MKVLVIGSTGMLGHEVMKVFSTEGFETIGTVRESPLSEKYFILDLTASPKKIQEIIILLKPTLVINCAGILKPIADKNPPTTIQVNSLAPHILAVACNAINAKLIHITTDCVYDGTKGMYSEEDTPTPVDFYGVSKLAGEITYGPHLTIRTSIIGHELRKQKYNLLDWFLENTAPTCRGFVNHFWNGVTTRELARFLVFITKNHASLQGKIHFYGESVSKYQMLQLFKEVYQKNIELHEYSAPFACNRTLTSLKLHALQYTVPLLKEQLIDLRNNCDLL